MGLLLRVGITIILGCIIANFFVIITPEKYYGGLLWGIWHGSFSIPNIILNFFRNNQQVKADFYNGWYNFFWWTCTIGFSIRTGLWLVLGALSLFIKSDED